MKEFKGTKKWILGKIQTKEGMFTTLVDLQSARNVIFFRHDRYVSDETCVSNQNLIAAAPELLNILIELVEDLQDEPISTSINDTLRRANIVISKALGE